MTFKGDDYYNYLFIFNTIDESGTFGNPPAPKTGQTSFQLLYLTSARSRVNPELSKQISNLFQGFLLT